MSYKPLNNGNNQLKIVCVYFVHGNVLLTWVSDTRTGFRHAGMYASAGFRHACMYASAGLRHAHAHGAPM